jgi:hypothetical protein
MPEGQRLSFAVRDGEIMLLNLKISDLDGNLLLDVVDGYVRQREASIELRTRPGAIEVPAGLNSPLIPNWIRERLLRGDEDYENLPLPLLSIEVIDRGVVRVQGFWMDTDKAIVITPERLSFISLGRQDPLALAAVGDEALLIWNGPIGASLFSWAS